MDIKHGKYLGVDYGDVRTGIAECDVTGMLASGICTIREGGMRNTAERVAREAAQRNCKKIVIGLPKNMDGSMGFRSEACQALGTLIQSLTEIPVVYWDERLTTVSAHRILSENNVRGKKRKNVVDAVAAKIILQDYIDYRKRAL